MNKYIYYSNLFFKVNNYYIYLLNPQKTLKYKFFFYYKDYFVEISNKKDEPLNLFFKIINKDNKCYYYNIYKSKKNIIKLNNFDNLNFSKNHKDKIFINEELLTNIKIDYPSLEIPLYNENLFDFTENLNQNKDFLFYNWYYFGRYNKYQYFKYIIYKNKTLFNEIYQKINYNLEYNKKNKYTLLFIDDRFDNIFQYILIMFLYSVNEKWNLQIYTTEDNIKKYQKTLKQYKIKAKFTKIDKFKDINDYSNLLKSNNFWNSFTEEYVLVFQYDSLAFSKFDNKFLNYNYIGAQWPKHIQQIDGIFNGNGGTSLRKVEIMKKITKKYNYIIHNEFKTPEDKYFSKYLFREKLLMNDPNISDDFSFENKYSDTSIYGHAIYECINLDKLENYIYNRLRKLLFL